MSLSQTVAEMGLIIKAVLYLFLRPFGASSIQGRLIIAEIRYISHQAGSGNHKTETLTPKARLKDRQEINKEVGCGSQARRYSPFQAKQARTAATVTASSNLHSVDQRKEKPLQTSQKMTEVKGRGLLLHHSGSSQ